jgi:hypothetical protein
LRDNVLFSEALGVGDSVCVRARRRAGGVRRVGSVAIHHAGQSCSSMQAAAANRVSLTFRYGKTPPPRQPAHRAVFCCWIEHQGALAPEFIV